MNKTWKTSLTPQWSEFEQAALEEEFSDASSSSSMYDRCRNVRPTDPSEQPADQGHEEDSDQADHDEEAQVVELLKARIFASSLDAKYRESPADYLNTDQVHHEHNQDDDEADNGDHDDDPIADREPDRIQCQPQNDHKTQLLNQLVSLPTRGQSSSSSGLLSPQKIDRMVERFRLLESNKNEKIKQQKRKNERQQQLTTTFRPALCKKSLELARDMPRFSSRQSQKNLLRKQHQENNQHAKQQQEIQARRIVAESVRIPCICGHPTTTSQQAYASNGMLARKQEDDQVSPIPSPMLHTSACMRFMATCARINQSYEIQRKRDHMRRSVDDMMTFYAEKKKRQEARVQVAKQQEVEEATFTPALNPKSMQLFDKMVRTGKLQRGAVRLFHPQPHLTDSSKQYNGRNNKLRPRNKKKSTELSQRQRCSVSLPTASTVAATRSHQLHLVSDAWQAEHNQMKSNNELLELMTHPPQDDPSALNTQRLPICPQQAYQQVTWNKVAFEPETNGFILQNFDFPMEFYHKAT